MWTPIRPTPVTPSFRPASSAVLRKLMAADPSIGSGGLYAASCAQSVGGQGAGCRGVRVTRGMWIVLPLTPTLLPLLPVAPQHPSIGLGGLSAARCTQAVGAGA